MFFWNKSNKQKTEIPVPKALARPSSSGRRFPLEIKLLAARAREAGLGPKEVGDLIGASSFSVSKWHKLYLEGEVEGLMLQSSSSGTQRICQELERRIELYRKETPDAGVRRIRDSLRRAEGLSVSAETVRRVVNDAGLGNDPPESKCRDPEVHRFERSIPNALWQIDIFTFELKRLYRVYLAGQDRVSEGASSSGRAACQEFPTPSDDARKDRALLENALRGVSLRCSFCFFCRRQPTTQPLDCLL
jgi:hypothetical protein